MRVLKSVVERFETTDILISSTYIQSRMTDDILYCSNHTYFSDETCPHCSNDGEKIMSGDRRRTLSGFLSGVLRHFPEDVGVPVDDQGWTTWTQLIGAATDKYTWASAEMVEAVVSCDPKGRYEVHPDGDRLRAAYGHSIDVTVESEELEGNSLPDQLYHGTAERFMDSISKEGLTQQGRNAVHLSSSLEDAFDVGSRHARTEDNVVILSIDPKKLTETQAVRNPSGELYTVSFVPPELLTIEE